MLCGWQALSPVTDSTIHRRWPVKSTMLDEAMSFGLTPGPGICDGIRGLYEHCHGVAHLAVQNRMETSPILACGDMR